MKKLIVLIALFVLVTFAAESQPKLVVVGGDTIHWGKVRLFESPLKKTLVVYNAGNEDLIFRAVTPSCGCTTAPIDKDTLHPGDSAQIEITFHIPNHAGLAKKGIRLSTNDPANRGRILILYADVVFPLEFFPSQNFIFSGLLAGDTMTAKVVVTNTTDVDIVIKQVKLTPAYCSTNLKNDTILKAKSDFTIEVTAWPTTIGMQTGELTFKTTHPDVVRVKIPIIMNIMGERQTKEKIPNYKLPKK
jgi:hypothetical protein